MISVEPIEVLGDNYVWVAGEPGSEAVVIVDPGDGAAVEAWLEARGAMPSAVLLTHHHGDHTGGAAQLAHRFGVAVYGPADESIRAVDHPVHGGGCFRLAPLGDVEVIACPGHTRGHVAYRAGDALFSGDALFAGGCGRLFEGSAADMLASLRALSAFADDTRLFCGHEYTLKNLQFAARVEPGNEALADRLEHVRQLRERGEPSLPATLGEERQTNPFLRTGVAELQRAVEQWAGRALDSEEAVLAALRRWKDTEG